MHLTFCYCIMYLYFIYVSYLIGLILVWNPGLE